VSGNYTSVQKKFISGKHPVLFPKNAIVRPKEFIYGTYEEKQTDVNMALHIFEGGLLDLYDKALIFS
jgi:hypothetical protein